MNPRGVTDDPVVVTGLGIATSIGVSAESFWANLLAGRCGSRPVTAFDVSDHPNQYGCEVVEPLTNAPPNWQDDKAYRASALFSHAAADALREAELPGQDLSRTGLCLGTTMGETGTIDGSLKHPMSHAHVAALASGHHIIARRAQGLFGLQGPLWTLTNACAAGNYAIARAAACLRAGEADYMLAGGVDALSWIAFSGFESLRGMAPRYAQPFSRNRKGMLMGEGAGVLVLERLSTAVKRGAHVYARILACGFSCDAHHIAQPDSEGRGAAAAMAQALRLAVVTPCQIDYISAHGTGTWQNDRAESQAVKAVFGDRAGSVPVSSIKAQLGHTLGAASAIEAVACCLALRDQVAPGTFHYEEPDPECPLDVIPNAPRRLKLRTVLSNAYAFGGNNSSLVLAHVGTDGGIQR